MDDPLTSLFFKAAMNGPTEPFLIFQSYLLTPNLQFLVSFLNNQMILLNISKKNFAATERNIPVMH